MYREVQPGGDTPLSSAPPVGGLALGEPGLTTFTSSPFSFPSAISSKFVYFERQREGECVFVCV